MAKIEPMSEAGIAKLVKRHDEPAHEYSCVEVRELIAAWIEARAQEAFNFCRTGGLCNDERCECRWSLEQHRNAVAARVGWVDD
jgi:hypothetical protein